jgi:transposase
MKNIKTIAIDLAKNVFQLHGADRRGKTLFRKRLSRGELKEFMVQVSPCIVGMEACMGSHYWARMFTGMGHTVRLIAPQHVKPFVKSNKNDRNDAAAISEAMNRPDMKFVGMKSIAQQDILLLHRARELLVKQRTSQANQIRGLLADYGIVVAKSIGKLRAELPLILEDAENELSPMARDTFAQLHERLKELDEQIHGYDVQLGVLAEQNDQCQRLLEIEGIGPITATAMVATVGDPSAFRCGREMAAWLGLVPKQHSSGNRVCLGGISKRGDRYLRTLLIHGARSVVSRSEKKLDKRSVWVQTRKALSGYNKAAVAVANKNARIAWALLSSGENYRPASVACA